MRKSKIVVTIIVMVSLLVIAAACGEDATPTPPPTTAVPAPTALQLQPLLRQAVPSVPVIAAVPSAPSPTPDPPHGSSLVTPTPDPPHGSSLVTPTPDPTHGSPLAPVATGSPKAFLTFDGVDYVHSGYAELPSGEGTVFVIDGIEIDLDDLEMVGTTYEGHTSGISEGLQVYRSAVTGDENAVYTFTPGETHVNPEDGLVIEWAAVWTRWTVSSN